MRKRGSRRKAVGTWAPILVEAKPNARWSLDFVHDQLACGRRFRILNIVDDVTWEFPLFRDQALIWPFLTMSAGRCAPLRSCRSCRPR